MIVGITLLLSLVAIGSIAGNGNTKNSSINAPNYSQAKKIQENGTSATKLSTINSKTITETQSIPFSKTSINDSSLAQSISKITTPGVNGIKTLTYKVTYTNGAQTEKELLSTVITTQPVTEVTSVGTYVAPVGCTNGTYVNSAGNTICSPEASPVAPAGATAQCVDGTYSFSQSHSGTCSHHGGVSVWL